MRTLIIREAKFRCLVCGAEWDKRRGNENVKIGDICGSMLTISPGKFEACRGRLVAKGSVWAR